MQFGGMQKFSLSDYPGLPACVVFTQGCNFRCPFCHNGSLLATQSRPAACLTREIEEYLQQRSRQLKGLVISGGEPTLHSDLPVFCRRMRELGYAIKLDTNGSRPQMLEQLLGEGLLDYVAMDIKSTFAAYATLAGTYVDVEAIGRSLQLIAGSGVSHHFRTTHVPQLISEDELRQIEAMVPSGSSFVVQRFRPELAMDARLAALPDKKIA